MKRPTIEVCWSCADLAGRLRPDCGCKGVEGLKILMARFRAGQGCSEDPLFQEQMMEVLNRGEEEEVTLMPSSDVVDLTVYGMRISQPYALLTDGEYAALFGASPKQLNLKPMSIPFQGPGSPPSNFYAMELSGLPDDLQLSCKKLELFYSVSSEHHETYLSHLRQIHQMQGEHVFRYVSQAEMARRPDKARPGAKPLTFDSLQEKHQLLEASTEAAAAEAAELDDDEPAPSAPQRQKQFGIVAKTGTGKVPKAKAKTSKANHASSTARMGPTASPAGPARPGLAPQAADDDGGSESTAAQAGKGAILAKLDKDMKLVAEKHLQNHSNASIKSLEHLQPLRFLLEPTKTLSICLTSVHASVFFLSFHS